MTTQRAAIGEKRKKKEIRSGGMEICSFTRFHTYICPDLRDAEWMLLLPRIKVPAHMEMAVEAASVMPGCLIPGLRDLIVHLSAWTTTARRPFGGFPLSKPWGNNKYENDLSNVFLASWYPKNIPIDVLLKKRKRQKKKIPKKMKKEKKRKSKAGRRNFHDQLRELPC